MSGEQIAQKTSTVMVASEFVREVLVENEKAPGIYEFEYRDRYSVL
jgi:hypothetical protein